MWKERLLLFSNRKMRWCSKNRPTMLTTLIFSLHSFPPPDATLHTVHTFVHTNPKWASQPQNPSCHNFKTQSCHKLKTLSCKANSSLAPWTHTYLTFGTPGRIRQMPRTMQSTITPAIEASYNFSTMTCRWMIIQKFHLVEKTSEHLKDLGCLSLSPFIP